MNARSQVFEIAVEARQVEEAVASIFHTVLFHRSFGKFTYQDDSSYIIGTIGYEDVDCDYIGGKYYLHTRLKRSYTPDKNLVGSVIFE